MKKIGLSLVSLSALLVSVVVFQNCGSFQGSPVTSNSSNVLTTPTQTCTGTTGFGTCSVANGLGTYPCSSTPLNCSAVTCNTGYVVSGAQCVRAGTATCTSGATQACSVVNGTGAQICSSGLWGSCAAISCNSGFILSGGTCAVNSGSGGSGLPCDGAFSAILLGQSMNLVLTQTSAPAFTMTYQNSVLSTGTCSGGNVAFNVALTSTSTATCSGTYTVNASGKTTMSGNCSAIGQTLPFSAQEQ